MGVAGPFNTFSLKTLKQVAERSLQRRSVLLHDLAQAPAKRCRKMAP